MKQAINQDKLFLSLFWGIFDFGLALESGQYRVYATILPTSQNYRVISGK